MRCNFATVMTVIQKHMSNAGNSYTKYTGNKAYRVTIFEDVFKEFSQGERQYDESLIHRWFSNKRPLSEELIKYYKEKDNFFVLGDAIKNRVLPYVADTEALVRDVTGLVLRDRGISAQKKNDLLGNYQKNYLKIAYVLLFAMQRPFDASNDEMDSPLAKEMIIGHTPAKPQDYFFGRDHELQNLHEFIDDNKKIILSGIAGIGKSELARAYARVYAKAYKNILWITSTSNMKNDIASLRFVDDIEPDECLDDRFKRHDLFLRSFGEDSLIVIDNFEATLDKDDTLADMLFSYDCKILVITRYDIEGFATFSLGPISDREACLKIFKQIYHNTRGYESTLFGIMEAVHFHTLAMEMAAKLLRVGKLNPEELLKKLLVENVGLNATDRILVTKDGHVVKDTYSQHIRLLFALFALDTESQYILKNMALIPLAGINDVQFAKWIAGPAELRDLNHINALVDRGLIYRMEDRRLSLHPLIQEVVVLELHPSVSDCSYMLKAINDVIRVQNQDVQQHQLLSGIAQNMVRYADKDNSQFYLRLLEDSAVYLEPYLISATKQFFADALKAVLDVGHIEYQYERIVFLDYQAQCEITKEVPNVSKALAYRLEAEQLLPPTMAETALLAFNIKSNLATTYLLTGNVQKAVAFWQQCERIVKDFCLPVDDNMVTSALNMYTAMTVCGNELYGLNGLRLLRDYLLTGETTNHGLVAEIEMSIATTLMEQGEKTEAVEYIARAYARKKMVCGINSEQLHEVEDIIKEYLNRCFPDGKEIFQQIVEVSNDLLLES